MVSIDYLVGRTENPLAHINVEADGRAVTKVWRREEIEKIERLPGLREKSGQPQGGP